MRPVPAHPARTDAPGHNPVRLSGTAPLVTDLSLDDLERDARHAIGDLREIVAAERLLVVCLSASPETVAARIEAREPDRWPGKQPLIERARRLASSTPSLPGIDMVIDTEQRTADEVAAEILEVMRRRGML